MFNFLPFLLLFFISMIYGETIESVHKESILEQSRELEKKLQRNGSFFIDSSLDVYLNRVIHNLNIPSFCNQPLRVITIKSPVFNAFATAHGVIYICTGLLSGLENEAQLAALLAHESIHIINEHACQDMINTKKEALSSAKSQIGLEFFFGSLASSAISNFSLKSAVYGYSQAQEREADSLGIIKLKEAGYAPIEFLNLFLILKENSEKDKNPTPAFFSTHPAISERIKSYYQFMGKDDQKNSYGTINAELFTKMIVNVLLEDASIRISSGKFDVAEKNLDRILKFDSCNTMAFYELANITRLRSTPQISEHVFNWYYKSISCNINNSAALRELGFYHFQSGNTDSAAYYFSNFKERFSSSPYLPIIEDYLKQCTR